MYSYRDEGYASGNSSDSHPEVHLTKPHLKFLNKQLQSLEPQGKWYLKSDFRISRLISVPDILQWCITTLPGFYQSTALGLTGLAMTDMISKLPDPLSHQVDIIFLDTLYHFQETLDLLDRVRDRYPNKRINVFKPADVSTPEEFEKKYGEKLWETDDSQYEWVAKVEPAQRAYRELGVNAVLTGRRRSQGAKRGDLDIIEVDEAGLIKVNPMANWTFQQVQEYIKANDVPYNELLDRGFKSIGDWHSTQPIKEGEDERAGRWKGQAKTECGIHNPRSKYAQFLRQQQLKEQEKEKENVLLNIEVGA